LSVAFFLPFDGGLKTANSCLSHDFYKRQLCRNSGPSRLASCAHTFGQNTSFARRRRTAGLHQWPVIRHSEITGHLI